MEAKPKSPIEDEILSQAAAYWGCTLKQVTFIREFANYAYNVQRNGQEAILRLTPQEHRTQALIQAELDWINYLADHGIPACRPLQSNQGHLVEVVPTGTSYLSAVLFTKAPGKPLPALEWADWGEALFRQKGQLLGRMHRLTQHYEVPEGAPKRLAWDKEDTLEKFQRGLGPDDEPVLAAWSGWRERFSRLESGRSVYGLVHTDVHAGNYFLHKGQIHLFDFDDACYHWFAYDIANALYYALWRIPRPEAPQRTAFAHTFLTALLAGYRQELPLTDVWVKEIPYFMEYRDLLVYSYLAQFVVGNPELPTHELLQAIRKRIVAGEPYVHLEVDRY